MLSKIQTKFFIHVEIFFNIYKGFFEGGCVWLLIFPYWSRYVRKKTNNKLCLLFGLWNWSVSMAGQKARAMLLLEKKKLLLDDVEFKIEFKNRLLFVWAFLICHWFVLFKRSILFYWDWRANGNCNSGVLPNIPRKSCWIMRNNWQVSWMMWCLAFVYDSFHPGISACMGYKYVVSTNPQTGLKLCCLNSSLLFGWNPCDSGNPGNQRGLATVVSQVECAYL